MKVGISSFMEKSMTSRHAENSRDSYTDKDWNF